jgi:hypothetical protein
MLKLLLPSSVDNTYHGHELAPWIFALLLLMKTVMSVNSIVIGHSVAAGADGIPIDTFTPHGAQTVISLFAIWGLAQFTLCLIGLVALLRYRALIPFLFALFLLEQLTRKLILHFLPMPTQGATTGHAVNIILPVLMVLGLALSLWRRDNHTAHGAEAQFRGER